MTDRLQIGIDSRVEIRTTLNHHLEGQRLQAIHHALSPEDETQAEYPSRMGDPHARRAAIGEYGEALVAFDIGKKKHAGNGRRGGGTEEVRGEGENRLAAIERTMKKLGKRHDRLHVCFEAGPTGHGLCRQIRDLGDECMVVAPALIPKRPGERVKTTLARLHRAG